MVNTHIALLGNLTLREIRTTYQGTVIGWMWPLLETLFMALIYTLFLSFFLKVRWGGASPEQSLYLLPLNLLVGLIWYNFFSECIGSSAELIRSQTNFVKKIIFPLHILPWVLVGVRGFYALLGVIVWALFFSIVLRPLPLTSFYCLLLIVPFVLLTLGISYFISSLAVYLKDLAKLVRFTITLLMFLSPVFYSTTSMSQQAQFYLRFNPLTYVIEQTRLCCFAGQPLDWSFYLIYTLSSLLIFLAGYRWFNRLKEGFADVL